MQYTETPAVFIADAATRPSGARTSQDRQAKSAAKSTQASRAYFALSSIGDTATAGLTLAAYAYD